MSMGRLFGVGVGPGDPELLTLKARRILSQVPVIFTPQSRQVEESFACSIVKGILDKEKQEIVPLRFPMTRDEEKLEEAWNIAVKQILRILKEGRDCAFITEGDPLLYSTFIHVYALLQKKHPGVPVEIVPGVSSVVAAAARARVPLAQGESSLAVLPATSDIQKIRSALASFDTLVFTKIDRSFDGLLEVLEGMGLADNAIWVKRCTTSEEEIVKDIRKLKGRKLDYFSLLIVKRGGF